MLETLGHQTGQGPSPRGTLSLTGDGGSRGINEPVTVRLVTVLGGTTQGCGKSAREVARKGLAEEGLRSAERGGARRRALKAKGIASAKGLGQEQALRI